MKKIAIIHATKLIFKEEASKPYVFLLEKIGQGEKGKSLDEQYEAKKSAGPLLLKETVELLANLSLGEFKSYIKEYLEKYLNPDFDQLVNHLKEKGYLVIIMSSNPEDFYLDFEVDKVIATQLEKSEDRLTGNIIDLQFKAPEKLKEKLAQFADLKGKFTTESNRYGLLGKLLEYMEEEQIEPTKSLLIGKGITALPVTYFIPRVIDDKGKTNKEIIKEIS